MVKVNKFYWWLSDTSALVYDGQFPYWENLDLDSLEYVTLNLAPTEEADITTWVSSNNAEPICWLETSDDDAFFFFEDWFIQYKDWVVVADMTANKDISTCIEYNWRVLWFYKDSATTFKIASIDIGDVWTTVNSWTAAWSYTETFKTWTVAANNSLWDNISVIIWNNLLFIWAWDSIFRLNKSDTLEQVLSWLPSDVIKITSATTFLRLYLTDWQVSIYDWASQLPDYTTNLWVSKIATAYWQRGSDWVVTWWTTTDVTRQLLNSNGITYESFKKKKNYVDVDEEEVGKFNFRSGASEDWDNTFTEYKGKVYTCEDNSLTSIWSIERWLPTMINKEIARSVSWDKLTCVSTLFKANDGNTLYFYYTYVDWTIKNKLCSWAKWPDISDDFYTSWSLYSRKFLMWRIRRRNNELYVRADVSATAYIEVYYRLDWWSWTSWATLNDDTTKTHIINNSLEYNEIELAFIFTGTTSVSPKMWEYEFNPLPIKREWQT